MGVLNSTSWYYPVVNRFKEEKYKGILDLQHLNSNEVVMKATQLDNPDKKYNLTGYKFKKDLKQYFLKSESIKDLPIKPVNTIRVYYKGEVYELIEEYVSIKIKPEKKLSFKELVDNFNSLKHSNDKHYFLYKLLMIVGWIDRINVRIISNQSFGKDSVVNNLISLTENGVNISATTLAKIEYELRHDFIVINEVPTLKGEEKKNLNQMFLTAGDFSPSYTKSSRGSKKLGIKEVYDLKEKSFIILHNNPEYYIDKGIDTFEESFTEAVYYRFLPFKFEGNIIEDFKPVNISKVYEDSEVFFKDFVKTLLYYKNSKVLPVDSSKFGFEWYKEEVSRFKVSFDKILGYLKEYDEKLYLDYGRILYNLFRGYEEELVSLGLKDKRKTK